VLLLGKIKAWHSFWAEFDTYSIACRGSNKAFFQLKAQSSLLNRTIGSFKRNIAVIPGALEGKYTAGFIDRFNKAGTKLRRRAAMLRLATSGMSYNEKQNSFP
jgi:hypothetical protein